MTPQDMAQEQVKQQQLAAQFAMMQQQGIAPKSPGATPTPAGSTASVTNPNVTSPISNISGNPTPTQSYLGQQPQQTQAPPNPFGQLNAQQPQVGASTSGSPLPGVPPAGAVPSNVQALQAITGS